MTSSGGHFSHKQVVSQRPPLKQEGTGMITTETGEGRRRLAGARTSVVAKFWTSIVPQLQTSEVPDCQRSAIP